MQTCTKRARKLIQELIFVFACSLSVCGRWCGVDGQKCAKKKKRADTECAKKSEEKHGEGKAKIFGPHFFLFGYLVRSSKKNIVMCESYILDLQVTTKHNI